MAHGLAPARARLVFVQNTGANHPFISHSRWVEALFAQPAVDGGAGEDGQSPKARFARRTCEPLLQPLLRCRFDVDLRVLGELEAHRESRLPDDDALIRRKVHLVAGLHAERLVESRLVHDRALNAKLIR